MPSDALADVLKGADCVIGVKQGLKALKHGSAIRVYMADDAEERLLLPLKELCDSCGTEIVCGGTMKELGAACGIKVGAAAVTVVRERHETFSEIRK